jgi:hemerythrin-like domain-containing protein
MAKAPTLLNDDGTASMATAVLMSHHGFRRDLGRFAAALRGLGLQDADQAAALRDEWSFFRGALHGHHEAEDQRLFPFLKAQHSGLGAVIDRLAVEHREIDPLLARGDEAFVQLPATGDAAVVIAELTRLLDGHLAFEEAEAIPYLRGAKEFPPVASEEELTFMAQGFAWSSDGVAADVLARVDAMLPAALVERLPAARAAFAGRVARAFGAAKLGASRTSIPD